MAIAESIHQAAQILSEAQRIVCLTGAGVSAESGLSTFRDPETGFWSKFDPQQLASQSGFAADPGLVWRWYMERLQAAAEKAKPNPGHFALATLESDAKNFTLITQNVDNLHERAGSVNVTHLHGIISRFHCNVCGKAYTLAEEEKVATLPPRCPACEGMIRPSVVWFGETLPMHELTFAWQSAEQCDVMLVVGTSGLVTPAAQLPYVAQDAGATLIDVNPEQGSLSGMADLFLQGPSGEILLKVVAAMEVR